MPMIESSGNVSGQLWGNALADIGSAVGGLIAKQKEEQKQAKLDASGFDALYKYAERSNNQELMSLLDPDGRGVMGMSALDKATRFKSGQEALKAGVQLMQAQSQAQFAATNAAEQKQRQRQFDRQAGQDIQSPLLGITASPDDLASIGNAITQLVSRGGMTQEQALSLFSSGGTGGMGGAGGTTASPGMTPEAQSLIESNLKEKRGLQEKASAVGEYLDSLTPAKQQDFLKDAAKVDAASFILQSGGSSSVEKAMKLLGIQSGNKAKPAVGSVKAEIAGLNKKHGGMLTPFIEINRAAPAASESGKKDSIANQTIGTSSGYSAKLSKRSSTK